MTMYHGYLVQSGLPDIEHERPRVLPSRSFRTLLTTVASYLRQRLLAR